MEKTVPSKRINFIYVCGRVCSGKDYVATSMMDHYKKCGVNVHHISVGNVVRTLLGNQTRVCDVDLDIHILTNLIENITDLIAANVNTPKPLHEGNGYDVVIIVSGLRSIGILDKLTQHYSSGECYKFDHDLKWIDTPDDVRNTFFNNRRAVKDETLSFDDVSIKDEVVVKGLSNFVCDVMSNSCLDIPCDDTLHQSIKERMHIISTIRNELSTPI